MKTEILFLGTGGDEEVISKQIRGAGGIVVKAEGYQFHMDPGPGALAACAAHKINVREHTAVLISHAHLNHCSDVNAILAGMSHNALDVKGVLIGTSLLVNGEEGRHPYVTEFHKKCVERIIVGEPGKKIGIEDIEIHLLKAKHKEKALGFKIITPKLTIVYTGDTGYNPELVKEYMDADVLIMNVVHPFDKKDEWNLNSDDVVNIIQRVQPQLAILTHFGKDLVNANPIYEAREISKMTNVEVMAVEEGQVVDVDAYADKTRQSKLDSFEGPEVTDA